LIGSLSASHPTTRRTATSSGTTMPHQSISTRCLSLEKRQRIGASRPRISHSLQKRDPFLWPSMVNASLTPALL
jgi:hypothetical protein